jgi:uncharacterized protein
VYLSHHSLLPVSLSHHLRIPIDSATARTVTMRLSVLLFSSLAAASSALKSSVACPDYSQYSTQTHEPLSSGKYKLSSMRPAPACRKFTLPEVEQTIDQMKGLVKDPDLFRLFENTFPNTLDTTISWKGFANNSTSEEVGNRSNP